LNETKPRTGIKIKSPKREEVKSKSLFILTQESLSFFTVQLFTFTFFLLHKSSWSGLSTDQRDSLMRIQRGKCLDEFATEVVAIVSNKIVSDKLASTGFPE
jgi:hypothetical protein